MSDSLEMIEQLTAGALSIPEMRRAVRRFATDLGWQPSDFVEGDRPATGHLLVEHGLQNSAVISFLERPFGELDHEARLKLLSLSYNNLVDWHVSIAPRRATFVFNRVEPIAVVDDFVLDRSAASRLRSEVFDEIVGRRPSANIPPLDDALIRTISHWKRLLAAELGPGAGNDALSALFNSLIFARAVEDFAHRKRRGQSSTSPRTAILDHLHADPQARISQALLDTILSFSDRRPPSFLFDAARIRPFEQLDRQTKARLIEDFYNNRFTRSYRYDFAVMSKHALSRIYEHYVSLLQLPDSDQLTFVPPVPEEVYKRATGTVFTPEFIARFFARFLRENIAPTRFRQLRPIDPACGSGIFLRTLLEAQCDPAQELLSDPEIPQAFERVVGIDADANAVQATRLSLALLFMVLTEGSFPDALGIHAAESFRYVRENESLISSFDVVVANPPFVSIEKQPAEIRSETALLLGELGFGRVDTYVAFLVQALRLLKPSGYGLFVLPHSFLLSDSAARVRQQLGSDCVIRFVVDLSGVRVFEHVDTYVVLLGLQKRAPHVEPVSALVVAVRDGIGEALQATLTGRLCETPSYSIHLSPQSEFSKERWVLRTPTEASLIARAEDLARLGDLFEIRLGAITGADDVFIVERKQVASEESTAFVPFLADREMSVYSVPARTRRLLFYPFADGRALDEDDLRDRFPATWVYLNRHKAKLEKRRAVLAGNVPWWRPERPRRPESLLRPKIVTPHLVIAPRFAIDARGRYAVSRSPYLYPIAAGAELDLMLFYVGVLNSSVGFWHIRTTSHRYQRGYAMLEPKTLRDIPVPRLQDIDAGDLNSFMKLVRERLPAASDALRADREIDDAVAAFYRLSQNEQRRLGIRMSE